MSEKKLRFLLAPNSFRGSLNAWQVTCAIEKGLQKASPDFITYKLPIADGGDYFTEVMIQVLGGKLNEVEALDPLGRSIRTEFGVTETGVAIIETAKASGNHLLERAELNPMEATSYGTGQLMKAALDAGCRKMMIGLGGSATVEGGVGILQALGVSFLDVLGNEVPRGGKGLGMIEQVDTSGLDPRLAACEIDVVCDVDNVLLGEEGAAAIFGPQKGASEKQVVELEKKLTHFAEVTKKTTTIDITSLRHGGAAGGIASGLHAYLNATLHPGTELVLQTIEFEKYLSQCDVVITGEGKLDLQTLGGKGPYGLALAAKEKGKKVIALAGAIPREGLEKFEAFDALFALADRPMSLEEAMTNSEQLLENIASQVGKLLLGFSTKR